MRPTKFTQTDSSLRDGNAAFLWDTFDSEWYLDHNYKNLREDDRQIIDIVGDFFASVRPRPGARSIDVGTGTNLYPALAALPLARSITLYERATSNVRWLRHQANSYAPSWDTFWDALVAGRPAYERVENPRRAIKEAVNVVQGSVFDLPKETWNIGTMFFVAECITARRSEFTRATRCFVTSLTRYAPFAAAFMKNSSGYDVRDQRFPAVAVDEDEVRRCLRDYVHELEVYTIESNDLRAGYDGMILATGHAG